MSTRSRHDGAQFESLAESDISSYEDSSTKIKTVYSKKLSKYKESTNIRRSNVVSTKGRKGGSVDLKTSKDSSEEEEKPSSVTSNQKKKKSDNHKRTKEVAIHCNVVNRDNQFTIQIGRSDHMKIDIAGTTCKLILSQKFCKQLKGIAHNTKNATKPPLCIIGYHHKEKRKTVFSSNFVFPFPVVVLVGQDSKDNQQLLECKKANESMFIVELPHKGRGIVVAREWKRVFCLLLVKFFSSDKEVLNYLSCFFVLDDDYKCISLNASAKKKEGKSSGTILLKSIKLEEFSSCCRQYLDENPNSNYISVSPARNGRFFKRIKSESLLEFSSFSDTQGLQNKLM